MDRSPAGCTLGHQRRSLETRRIEHGGEVSVEDLLRQGVMGITLGCTQASAIEPEGAAEGAHPPAEAAETGIVV